MVVQKKRHAMQHVRNGELNSIMGESLREEALVLCK